jgi:hypothetical protein
MKIRELITVLQSIPNQDLEVLVSDQTIEYVTTERDKPDSELKCYIDPLGSVSIESDEDIQIYFRMGN